MTESLMHVPDLLHVTFLKNLSGEDQVVRPLPWEGLSGVLRRVRSGEKEGFAWRPAIIEQGAGCENRVKAVSVLVLNVEGTKKRDSETGVATVIGPEPPGVCEMADRIEVLGFKYVLHTTFSHLDPEILPTGVPHPHYRLVFALSRPLKPDEVRPLGHHVASILGILDCFDRGGLEPDRLFYFPRTPASRVGLFEFREGKGEPLNVDALLSEARRAEKALQAAAKIQGMDTRPLARKPEPEPEGDLETAVHELANLSALEYDRVREEKAKVLGVRVATLDKVVSKARVVIGEEISESVVEEISPYPEPADGAELVDAITRLYRRHCVMSEADYTVLAVSALGTFVFDAFSVYPRLLFRSPEMRCGKTVVLEVTEAVVYRGLMASSITPAATFRIIDTLHPTLLIDEGDTFVRNNEAMRGVVNSSHRRRAAFVYRVEKLGIKGFSTWTPIYIAGIGSQAGTIEDRSIVIDLRRKLPGERVLKCPVDLFERTRILRSRCLRWAQDHMDKLRRSDFEVPACGNDRAADNWFPLMAIAKLIGEPWESRLMSAYVEKNHQGEDESTGVMLLRDIRHIFDETAKTRIHAEHLVDALVELPDRPWEEWKHGKPMTKTSLSRLLKPYKIRSRQLRIGKKNLYGYEAEQFTDAWARYTEPSTSEPLDQNPTTLHPTQGAGCSGFENATPDLSVAFSNSRKHCNGAGCSEVAFSQGGSDGNTCPQCCDEGRE